MEVKLGTVVYFKSHDQKIYAAVVSSIRETARCDLAVFHPTQMHFIQNIPHSTTKEPGCWHLRDELPQETPKSKLEGYLGKVPFKGKHSKKK